MAQPISVHPELTINHTETILISASPIDFHLSRSFFTNPASAPFAQTCPRISSS